MYIFLDKLLQTKDIKEFNIHQSTNENFVNYRVNFASFSIEEKEQFIKSYKLKDELLKYGEDIFLAVPISKTNQNMV